MQPAIVPSRRVEPVSRLTSDLDIDGCMYMKNVRDKLAPRRGPVVYSYAVALHWAGVTKSCCHESSHSESDNAMMLN